MVDASPRHFNRTSSASLLDTEAITPSQEGGEQQTVQDAETAIIRGDSRRCIGCHNPFSRRIVFMSSSIVGMFIMAAICSTVLRAVMKPGLGKSTAGLVLAKHLMESPMALTTLFFLIILACAAVMFCIWHLAHWQEARDTVAEQRAEEERRKKNLLRHLKGTEAFEMPPPDKPVPRRAGTCPSASQDEERRSMCAICLEPLNTGDPCRLLPCNHIFHTECTDTWLQDRFSCPTCRQDIRAPEDVPAEPQQQRRLPPAVRIVLIFICIGLLAGGQERIMDAIFGSRGKEPQNHHVKVHGWTPAESSHQNVTAAHHFSIYGSVDISPQAPTEAQAHNSVQRIYSGGFLRA